MRGVDLVPSDEVVALLLLAAHQRNMRRRHIKRKLAGKSCCQGPPHLCHEPGLQPSDAMTSPHHKQPHNYPQHEKDQAEEPNSQTQQESGKFDQDRQLQQTSSSDDSPTSDSPSKSDSSGQGMTGADSCTVQYAKPLQGNQHGADQQQHEQYSAQNDSSLDDEGPQEQQQYRQQQQQRQQQQLQHPQQPQRPSHQAQQDDSQEGRRHSGTSGLQKQSNRPSLKDIHLPTGVDVEQGWGRGNDTDDANSDVGYDDDSDVAVFEQARGCGFPCVITPSSTAAELAPHLTQQQAAQIYLGNILPTCKQQQSCSAFICQHFCRGLSDVIPALCLCDMN